MQKIMEIMRNLVAPLALVTLLGACADKLYIAHDTVIGINASVNTARTSGRIIIGYDRHFVVFAPKSVKQTNFKQNGVTVTSKGANHKEAMSVLACSELEIKGIFLTKYTESLATGLAARLFAENTGDGNSANVIFDCYTAEGK